METKVFLNVEGMTCTNCAAGVKRQLEKRGLSNVNVDFTTGEAIYDFDKKDDKESSSALEENSSCFFNSSNIFEIFSLIDIMNINQ